MDLFDFKNNDSQKNDSPLAQRMKPKTLQEFVGQEHILAPGSLLWRAIKADRMQSIVLYGPPGTGKTSLAQVIAKTTSSRFIQLNAVTAGIKDIKEAVVEAKNDYSLYSRKTILFLDEIHRFNKAQQDALLPFVEDGTLILIGATTENPFFEINKALLSRSLLFELKPLNDDNIRTIIDRTLSDNVYGLGMYSPILTDEAIDFLIGISVGDARAPLNTLELAVLTTTKSDDGHIHIDKSVLEECVQKKNIKYDKTGDYHYDIISAFIKSIRGSDPDAALHYLARMLYAGEDPMFIGRRIAISASEDIGNADPMALIIANNALQAIHLIGMPEAKLILAQAVTYLACAPKSNAAYIGINAALKDIDDSDIGNVPKHLKNVNGGGYVYPHDFPNHYVKQQYLPDAIVNKKYYNISEEGYEAKMKAHMAKIKDNRD